MKRGRHPVLSTPRLEQELAQFRGLADGHFSYGQWGKGFGNEEHVGPALYKRGRDHVERRLLIAPSEHEAMQTCRPQGGPLGLVLPQPIVSGDKHPVVRVPAQVIDLLEVSRVLSIRKVRQILDVERRMPWCSIKLCRVDAKTGDVQLSKKTLEGVEVVINLLFSKLPLETITELRGGPLGLLLTVSSLLFLVSSLAFVLSFVVEPSLPRIPLALYVIGAVPIALRAFVPEWALDLGLVSLAAAVAWLSGCLWTRAGPLTTSD